MFRALIRLVSSASEIKNFFIFLSDSNWLICFNLPNQSIAASVSDTPLAHAFTNAEIRNASVSSTSTFTSKGFNNGDFSKGSFTQNGKTVSIPGWDITLGPIDLGPDDGPWDDLIGGHPTPTDTKTPNTMQTGTTQMRSLPTTIGEPNAWNPDYQWGLAMEN